MAIPAGYNSSVRVCGSPVASTGEAFTNSDGGTYKEYQITDTTKRVLWPTNNTTPIVVYKNGSAVSASAYTVDYLFGKVTFGTALLNTDVVTADVSYLPGITLGLAKQASVKVSRAGLDTTSFGSGGYKQRIAGQADAEITLGTTEPTLDHYATGLNFDSDVDSGSVLVIEFKPDGSRHEVWRAFVLADSTETKAAMDAIVEGTITFKAADLPGATGVPQSSRGFGWGVDN